MPHESWGKSEDYENPNTMNDKILAKIKEILIKRGISPDWVGHIVNEARLGHELWEEAEHELMGEDYERKALDEAIKKLPLGKGEK